MKRKAQAGSSVALMTLRDLAALMLRAHLEDGYIFMLHPDKWMSHVDGTLPEILSKCPRV